MTRHNRARRLKGLLCLYLLFAGVLSGCSSAQGPGNVLAGQACDSFTIDSDPACACCSAHPGRCTSGVSACAPSGASATCGDPCPSGMSCTQVDGKAVCGTPKNTCTGPAEQTCGSCGTQTRSCQAGAWSDWSACESVSCTVGEVRSCATGQQTCVDGCTWSSCSEPPCTPGQTKQQACGRCGMGNATCQNNGSWSPPVSCTGEGECAAGVSQACGTNKTQTCTASCSWGTCQTQECSPGETSTEACGFCGMRARSCDAGQWSAFGACDNPGECQPDSTEACGQGGMHTCSNTCEWSACSGQTCTGSYVQSCGVCGIQTRTCSNGTWSSYSQCVGERDCIPGSSESCPGGGKKACNFMCYWDACQ